MQEVATEDERVGGRPLCEPSYAERSRPAARTHDAVDPAGWDDHRIASDEIDLCEFMLFPRRHESQTHPVDSIDAVAEPLLFLLVAVAAPLLVLVQVLRRGSDEEKGLAAAQNVVVDARSRKVDVL